MRTHVSRWGNSLAIRVPASFAREVRLDDGDAVELQIVDGRLLITPIRSGYSLEQLVSGITDDNLHAETDWGPSVGRESW